jgi:hypothetical protein
VGRICARRQDAELLSYSHQRLLADLDFERTSPDASKGFLEPRRRVPTTITAICAEDAESRPALACGR